MDFKQLQTYATVVECQSFTKAAQQLYVSQPTISAHVRALEEELHATLIERTTKSITVTQKGREVYDYAVSILDIRERMIQACSQGQKRVIRVAASTIPAAYMLPQILPEYGRLFPQVYFSIHQGRNGEVLASVEDGRFDLGFSTERSKADMVSIPVGRDRMVLITPVTQQYLELAGLPDTPVDRLLACPIILREKMETGQKLADRYLAALGVAEDDLQVVARANDQETVKSLVAGGMGISLISYWAAQNFIAEKRVLCFELPVHSEKTIYLVSRKTECQQEHVRHFCEFVQKKYGQEKKKD